jgi:hypothetical protein
MLDVLRTCELLVTSELLATSKLFPGRDAYTASEPGFDVLMVYLAMSRALHTLQK